MQQKCVILAIRTLNSGIAAAFPGLAAIITEGDREVGIGRTTWMSGNNLGEFVDTQMLAAIMPARRTGKPVAAG